MGIPEYPGIARTLATGYPEPEKKPVVCEDCGTELIGTDLVFDWDGDHLCEDCFVDRVTDNYSPKELADRLGYITFEADESEA